MRLERRGGIDRMTEKRKKVSYVGAPAIFKLHMACHTLTVAFGATCYLVGSSLERSDWRDIDVRMMLEDEAFTTLFPSVDGAAMQTGSWEFDPRWQVMTSAISDLLSKQTGLPVDFQFQPRSRANEHHKGARHAIGLRLAPPDPNDSEQPQC